MALENAMYIKRESTIADNSYKQNICFVCGNIGHTDQYWLRIKPNSNNAVEAYFPFLENHEPPGGYRHLNVAKQDSIVCTCYLCYSLLLQQWDRYQRDNVPHSRRIYWLKRCDNGVYTGAEMSSQGEYASQVLGINFDYSQSKDTIASVTTNSSVPIINDTNQSVATSSSNNNRTMECKNTELTHTQQPPLDLRQSPIIVNTNGHANSNSNPGSYSSSGTDILDLSMPDKNSTTEVCYVCGDEFKRGSLCNVSAKPSGTTANTADAAYSQQGIAPFFPSLTLHPRPSKSRPMDSNGRVQACNACYSHLIQQWQMYGTQGVAHSDRNYALRRKAVPLLDTSTFICYICSLEYPSTCARFLYCCPNNEKEPYYRFICNLKAPTGAAPINAEGMVQVCSICYKTVPQKHQALGVSPESPGLPSSLSISSISSAKSSDIRFRPYELGKPKSSGLTSSPVEQSLLSIENSSNCTSANVPRDPAIPAVLGPHNFRCYICGNGYSKGQMEWLSTGPEGLNSHAMHFPCLRTLVRSSENSCVDSQGRILACVNCSRHLAKQWDSLEAEKVPLERRRYEVPTSNSNGSTPPPPPIAAPNSSSIYCFLCGLHSDLTLARVLYSQPQGRNGPYFSCLLNHQPNPSGEQLRENGSALVCTFCYHTYIEQWRQFESNNTPMEARHYVYNEYRCIVCSVITPRKRARALFVNEFPFLRLRCHSDKCLLLENGDYAVVCQDCYETLRTEARDFERWGNPMDSNWANQLAIENSDKTAMNDESSCKTNHNKYSKQDDSRRINQNHTGVAKLDQGILKSQVNAMNKQQRVSNTSIGASPQLSPNMTAAAPAGRSFAAALRNLAKQAGPVNNELESETDIRQPSPKSRRTSAVRNASHTQGHVNKSTEKDKTAVTTTDGTRSGFQPYRPEEARLTQPIHSPNTTAFSLDPSAYTPYHHAAAAAAAAAAAGFYPPHLQHAYRLDEQLYLERCGMAMFPPPSPYPPHLYGVMPSPLGLMTPAIHERLKLEEEHRQREIQERERERDREKREKHKRSPRASPSHSHLQDLSGRRQ